MHRSLGCSDFIFAGGATYLALQPFLGILPKRRTRAPRHGRSRSAGCRSAVTVEHESCRFYCRPGEDTENPRAAFNPLCSIRIYSTTEVHV